MDMQYIISLLVAVITILGFVYGFLRNFKMDIKNSIHKEINGLEKRMTIQDDRIEKQNMRLDGIYTILLNNNNK